MLFLALFVLLFFLAFSSLLLFSLAKLLEHYIRSFEIENIRSKYVFITGCDSGFGNLLAKSLDRKGVPVFAACLTDQGMVDLQEQCSSRLKALKLNVTKEEDIQKAVEFVKDKMEQGGKLWGVVNNAGVMSMVAPAEWHQKEDYEKTIAVNLLGTVMVTTKFLPLLRKSRGRIVNMASIVTMVPMPNLAAYTVSKAGVEAFSDTLRREMYSIGVGVHTIHPTGFRTNICPDSIMARSISVYKTKLSPDQQAFYKSSLDDLNTASQIQDKLLDGKISKVTDQITHALFSRFPKTKYLVGPGTTVIFWPVSLLPFWMSDFVFQGGPNFTNMCKRFFRSKG